jgi:hypothetical protein
MVATSESGRGIENIHQKVHAIGIWSGESDRDQQTGDFLRI